MSSAAFEHSLLLKLNALQISTDTSDVPPPRLLELVERGQIRSLFFTQDDGRFDQRYVLILEEKTNLRAGSRDVVEVVLIGEDVALAGINDILLNPPERPCSSPSFIQMDLRFPAFVRDLGPVYSMLQDETSLLLDERQRLAGREIKRAGLQRDENFDLRVEFLDDQLELVRVAAMEAIQFMSTVEFDAIRTGLKTSLADRIVKLGQQDYPKSVSNMSLEELRRLKARKLVKVAA